MIDNFNLIEPFFYFNEANNMFFHLQIIQRKKEHPEIGSNNHIIKQYYIQSRESLQKQKDEIITLCEVFKARAYININAKDFDSYIEACIMKFAQRVFDHNYAKPYKIPSSVAGELKSRNSRWIIDIDTKDGSIKSKVSNEVEQIYKSMGKVGNCIISTIPTKNGVHLITHPFRLDKFKELEPEIDIHKNNPTILYIPKSLDNA